MLLTAYLQAVPMGLLAQLARILVHQVAPTLVDLAEDPLVLSYPRRRLSPLRQLLRHPKQRLVSLSAPPLEAEVLLSQQLALGAAQVDLQVELPRAAPLQVVVPRAVVQG